MDRRRSHHFHDYSRSLLHINLMLQIIMYNFFARAQFHQRSTYSFYVGRSQKCKKILMTLLYFLRFWDLQMQKLLVERWWNWHQKSSNILFTLQNTSAMWNRNVELILVKKSQMNIFWSLLTTLGSGVFDCINCSTVWFQCSINGILEMWYNKRMKT